MNNINFEIRKFSHPPFFFTDLSKVCDYEKIIEKLPKNSAIIIREYNLDKNSREIFARRISQLARAKSLKIIVGKDFDLAKKIKAHGVHFSDHDKLPLKFLKKNQPKNFIFSFACHNLKSFLKAQKLRPDVIFISPIFATTSHPNGKNIGIRNLSKIIRNHKNKKQILVALGGINSHNIKMLCKLKINGFGAIDFFNKE